MAETYRQIQQHIDENVSFPFIASHARDVTEPVTPASLTEHNTTLSHAVVYCINEAAILCQRTICCNMIELPITIPPVFQAYM